MKSIIAAFLAIIIAACSQSRLATAGEAVGELTSDSLIQRIVCFRFRPGTTEAQKQQHMRGFQILKDSIPYILSYRVGPTVPADLPDKGEYDVMHYTTYRSEETIRLYAVHPVHQRFIQQNQAVWEKVLVINSRIRP
jgi:hypothetical protein